LPRQKGPITYYASVVCTRDKRKEKKKGHGWWGQQGVCLHAWSPAFFTRKKEKKGRLHGRGNQGFLYKINTVLNAHQGKGGGEKKGGRNFLMLRGWNGEDFLKVGKREEGLVLHRYNSQDFFLINA